MTDAFADPVLQAQIAHVEEIAPVDPRFGETTEPMHPLLRERLEAHGATQLYTHQARAYDLSMAGHDVVVTTGTNSGKTLCYNLPALQTCLTEPAARCLYLFPTKALAQDQLGRLHSLLPEMGVKAATYDGDTPVGQRAAVRRLSHILLTNPDMLHLGILPGHEHWGKFLRSLRLIVLDEMHVYRGVFGSNVGNVLRRLLRLCEWHRAKPRIVACSATIGNPREVFKQLTGREAVLVDEDGSPHGKRTFVFWNPPEIGEGRRLSANVTTSEILTMLAETGQRTLAFSRARVSAELVLRYARRRAEGGGVKPEAIESYRAGYTPKERRGIEQALFKGKLLGLSATNAMELGVDVGGLDAVVINGYPGTGSSFWQQAGRAGRGTRDGLAVFVAHEDPLDQFLVRQPRLLLDARNERVGLNPQNPQILSAHLRCAAHERPLAPSEMHLFGENAVEAAEAMDRSGELEFRAGLFFYPSVDPPAPKVSIRGGGGDAVRLMVGADEIGSMEKWRAMTSAHGGAVYLHRGASFLVHSLDLELGIAQMEPQEVGYYTQTIVRSVLDAASPFAQEGDFSLSGLNVTDVIEGFRKRSLDGDSVLAVEDLDMPPQSYDTVGVRLDLPALDTEADPMLQIGGVHGLEHALLAVAPLLAGCDRGDLGSAWYAVFPDTLRPAVFVFDKTPGGVGLSEKLFESREAWLSAALDLLRSCPCEEGCPACLLSARCEAMNETLNKSGTIETLLALRA
ncbi:DEAD/DEAH box helicase [bacterium]|nr:MAG: DEAD/DEAH box helicase [bacterium]